MHSKTAHVKVTAGDCRTQFFYFIYCALSNIELKIKGLMLYCISHHTNQTLKTDSKITHVNMTTGDCRTPFFISSIALRATEKSKT
jgi:hypothetical protein